MEVATGAPRKILVVEDDPEIRAATVRLLSRTGYQVFEAENGASGLDAILAVRPDLVLSDVVMPEVDGLELCRRVRANAEVDATLFMFLSSTRTKSNEQADGLDVGADGYIVQPISNRELVSRVSALIRIVEANARANAIALQAAERERLARQVLESLNNPASTKDAIHDILRSIKGARDFEAVAIRLRECEDFTYYETSGFSEDFVRLERIICAHDEAGDVLRDAGGSPVLECMCGHVLRGQTDPTLPYFTRDGSFWCNSRTALLGSNSANDPKGRARNRCYDMGFESVALIPLRVGRDIIGLLQINDHRPDQFTPELIRYLEGLSASIGIALGRKRAEEALRESESRLNLALVSAQMGTWQWDSATNRHTFGERVYRLFGLDPATFLGTGTDLFTAVHPDDREMVQAKSDPLRALDAPYTLEYRVVWPDGSVHHIASRGGLTRAPDGRPLRIDGVLWDITERKRSEEEKDRLQARLAQAKKMESVGLLAGGVAHYFNNMLGVILGHSELALDQLDPALPIRANLEHVCQAARRSADLTRQLLAYARKQTIAPTVVDLNAVVAGASTALRQLLGKDIDLAWRPAASLWPVKVDPTQIDQILTALCTNAKHAIAGAGTVTVETGNCAIQERERADHAEVPPGDYVRLAVSDTGCGMDHETQSHIFEPFFTTRGVGQGTGLGLAVVYGAIKQNGGFIECHSKLGQGTTFTLYLPRRVLDG